MRERCTAEDGRKRRRPGGCLTSCPILGFSLSLVQHICRASPSSRSHSQNRLENPRFGGIGVVSVFLNFVHLFFLFVKARLMNKKSLSDVPERVTP